MTGATSAWFHATLIFMAQKADEFFENVAVLSLFYLLAGPGADLKSGPALVHSLLLGVGVVLIPELFCEVHLAVMIVGTLYRGKCRLSEARMKAAHVKHLALVKDIDSGVNRAALCAAVGFGLWLVDMLACQFRIPLTSIKVQDLLLHAYGWHILTGIALYEGGAAVMKYHSLYDSPKEKHR
jgi:hypothetical protein